MIHVVVTWFMPIQNHSQSFQWKRSSEAPDQKHYQRQRSGATKLMPCPQAGIAVWGPERCEPRKQKRKKIWTLHGLCNRGWAWRGAPKALKSSKSQSKGWASPKIEFYVVVAVLCCATTLNAKRKRERAPVLIRETHRLCMQWSSVQRPDHAERVSPRVISRAQAGPWRLAGILDKTSGVHSTLYRRRLLQANLRSWFFNTFIFRDIPYILKSPFGVRAWLHILWIIFYSRFFAWVKTFVNGERAGKPHFRGSTSSTIVKVKHKLYKTRLLEM